MKSHSPLAPYIGGKSAIAGQIVEMVPECKVFADIFGGAGNVLFEYIRQRGTKGVLVYNDLDGTLVNFMLQIRDHYFDLHWKLRYTPWSDEVHRAWLSEMKEKGWPKDKLEWAARWYWLIYASYNGHISSGWSHAVSKNTAREFAHALNKLAWYAEKLRYVQISQRDFEECIGFFDSEDTVSYIDSPYLLEGIHQAADTYYGPQFGLDDHRRLARVLSTIKGKAIVSYYPHKLLDELYPKEKWHRVEIEVYKRSSGKDKGCVKPKATELLITNYRPPNRLL